MDFCVADLNMTRTDTSGMEQEIDSTKEIKKILGNLDNHEMQTPEAILQQQAHLVNYKKQRIVHMTGLREIILLRNKLSDRFAKFLSTALAYDKYIKVINIAGNNMTQTGLKMLIKHALIENSSII